MEKFLRCCLKEAQEKFLKISLEGFLKKLPEEFLRAIMIDLKAEFFGVISERIHAATLEDFLKVSLYELKGNSKNFGRNSGLCLLRAFLMDNS